MSWWRAGRGSNGGVAGKCVRFVRTAPAEVSPAAPPVIRAQMTPETSLEATEGSPEAVDPMRCRPTLKRHGDETKEGHRRRHEPAVGKVDALEASAGGFEGIS